MAKERITLELIRQIQSGDRLALLSLEKQLKGILYRLPKRGLEINSSFVDDIIQDSLVVVFKAVHGYNESKGAAFSTYVMQRLKGYLPRLLCKYNFKGSAPESIFTRSNKIIQAFLTVHSPRTSYINIDDYYKIVEVNEENGITAHYSI